RGIRGAAVASVARAGAASGARLLPPSADYVFSGDAASPYREDAPTAPLNAYGRSKLAGELAIAAELPRHGYVVRTAWLYGEHGGNFVATMLRMAGVPDPLDVVVEQRGQPTRSFDPAQQL